MFRRRKKNEPEQATAGPSAERMAAQMRYVQQNMEAMAAMGVQGIPIRGNFGVKDTAFVSRRNCPSCGAAIQFQAKFCHACGKPVPPPSDSVPTPPAPVGFGWGHDKRAP